MKRYDKKAILKFTEANKDDIKKVYAGMAEDWKWTYATMYNADEDYIYPDLLTDEEYLEICGINGSIWATPTLVVVWRNNTITKHDCYKDDSKDIAGTDIIWASAFAKDTGGGDSVDEFIECLEEELKL
jgi:hypothetical protein